jgi:hypothetical protein
MKPHNRFFWFGFAVAIGGVLAIAVVAFAGGGESATPSSQPATAGTKSATLPEAQSAADALGVFDTTRTAADALPPAAAKEANALASDAESVPAELQPGAFGLAQSRLLLSDVGTRGANLYAFPTSKGQVCALFDTHYGLVGCFARFTAETPISWDVMDLDQVGAGDPPIVDGLVPDDVVSVGVSVGGELREAVLQNNAFFYELDDATAWPEAIVVSYRDGSARTVSLVGPPSPQP